MFINSNEKEELLQLLRSHGEMTSKQILEFINFRDWATPRGLSESLSYMDEIVRIPKTKPYKYKAIPTENILKFTGEWKKERNVIKFYFKDNNNTLDYDFNTNNFVNFDINKKYLNATNFIKCFLDYKPVRYIEWVFNYPELFGNDYQAYRLTQEDMKEYKTCPIGYIKFLQDNNLKIFGYEESLAKYKMVEKIKKYFNEKQAYNLIDNANLSKVEDIIKLVSNVGKNSLLKILSNSIKNFEFIRAGDIQELYLLCEELNDFIIDTNRTLIYNINNKKQLKEIKDNEMLANKLQKLNFLNNKIFEDYVVIVPQNIIDLQNEGQQQHNCVGYHYNNSIIKGLNLIYFLRHKDTPNESCVTCRYNLTIQKTQEKRIKNNYNTSSYQDHIIEMVDNFINKNFKEE